MQQKMTWPLLLTWVRIILVPVFVAVFYVPDSWLPMHDKNLIAAIVFAFAAITDYLDGYLARLLNQESSFGAFLDPVADKAIVVASLLVLVSLNRTFMFAAVIIIIREITISALREWMAQIGQKQGVAVAYIGKLKTALQMIAIELLLFDNHTNFIGNVFMLLAVIMTVISMIYYLEQAKKHL